MGLYYTELSLPTGRALAAATDKGITRLELKPPRLGPWLASLAAEFGETPVKDAARFGKLVTELESYFAGRKKKFGVKLDISGTRFQKLVWDALLKVPYGSVVSYGELAAMAGSPGSARAVGGAMNRNRVPIIIPCHRVVESGGGLGGYGGGIEAKKMLLGIEGVLPAAKKRQ